MPKRALIVNHCGAFWPSGLVRALQYRPYFDADPNWDVEFTTRQSEFIRRLLSDKRLTTRLVLKPFRRGLANYSWRWQSAQEDKIVELARHFDVVTINKSPGIQLFKRIRALNGPRLILDINDAVWLPMFEWGDLAETLAMVDAVICENEYVAAYARRHNPRVSVVPDSPQIEVFDQIRDRVRRDPEKITLGWVGGSQNIGPLLELRGALEGLFARHPQLHLRVVGASPGQLEPLGNLRFSCRPTFNQMQMAEEILAFDIGLFPLFRNEDGLARGTLKALVYMSGGTAVIGEDFGENPGLIQDGVNGVLASSPTDWERKLEALIVDPQKRSAIAAAGLETVRTRFTTAHIFKRMISVYDSVLS